MKQTDRYGPRRHTRLPWTAAAAFCVASVLSVPVAAQDGQLSIELNTVEQADAACRVTFMAQNGTGSGIDKAVFETVIFTNDGKVDRLTLFDFRDLPAGRPRVRQFDLAGLQCADLGRLLINGANTCTVSGTAAPVCDAALKLQTLTEVELLG